MPDRGGASPRFARPESRLRSAHGMTFNELGLAPEIMKAIDEVGYTEPTPIQAQAIPREVLSGHDVLGIAQTGTGKRQVLPCR